jgi:hypothetical protein
MNQAIVNALNELTQQGRRLRDEWRFDWPESIQQTVHRVRLEKAAAELPPFAAVVGGASSGKSTVFNNLLDGHLTSRITARGHATLGPILAIHEDHLSRMQPLLDEGLLFPGYRRIPAELDDNVTGDPVALVILHHDIDALRDVLLFDTPDFTSDAALKEGDVALSLLPWFDRLVVVVDHERWFDRQSISKLRAQSTRFDQDRFVLFNRTREGPLAEVDEIALQRQAERLSAHDAAVLQFRRGRGFRLFPPGTLDHTHAFLQMPTRQRTEALLSQAAETANRVLNQNEERTAHLSELRESLRLAAARVIPSMRDCMISLMTAAERRRLEVVSRVLRICETTDWMRAQQQRVKNALTRMPILGPLVSASRGTPHDEFAGAADRLAVATSYYEAVLRRQTHEVQRVIRTSAFWNEIRRWTGLEPADHQFEWPAIMREEVRGAVGAFDAALERWTAKVEAECQGISPHLQGAVAIGTIALAIVLIAVPGPVTALTLVSAKGAIGAALGHIATATGAGALFGKQMGRFTGAVREKLLGSPELDAVQAAANGFREHLESTGRQLTDDAVAEASALVLGHGEPLAAALDVLRNPPGEP